MDQPQRPTAPIQQTAKRLTTKLGKVAKDPEVRAASMEAAAALTNLLKAISKAVAKK